MSLKNLKEACLVAEREPTELMDYSPEDLALYKELAAKMQPDSAEQVDSPEFQKLWTDFEKLRNKYNGNPPKQLASS